MSTSVETQKEKSFRDGKTFTYYDIKLGEIPDAPDKMKLVLVVGKHAIAIDKLAIKGNSAWIKWSLHTGGDVDMLTGTELNATPLNVTEEYDHDTMCIIDPDTSGAWVELYNDIPIYGVEGAKSYTIMNEEILTRKMAFPAYSTHMLDLENNDAACTHIEVIIDFEVM